MMKDSGIAWIGKIPDGWEVSRIKYCGEYQNGLTYTPQNLCDENEGTLVLRSSNVQNGKIVYDDNVYVNCEIPDKAKIRKNDILICSRNGSRELIGKCAIYDSDEKAAFGAFMMIYRCKNPKFMYYVLNSNIFFANIGLFSTSTVNQLTGNVFGNIQFPLPPLPAQQKIADFLDAKCARLDSLSASLRAQIGLLEEYKKSVITEAVTGKRVSHGFESGNAASLHSDFKGRPLGLPNPCDNYKDSGIEWIGEIPEGWKVHPVYYYFEERKNKNSLGQEQNLLSLSYGNIKRKDINTLEGLLPESFNTYNIVEKGDIIIRPTDLQNDKRSLRTGLCKEHGIITSAYIALKPKKNINSDFFHYLLHVYDIEKVFYNMGNGVRQGLNYSEFSKLLVFAPPLAEQTSIADYLDSVCAKIDSAVSSKRRQLETLDEYKKSLIFEYVTGKKQVFSDEFASQTSQVKKEVL